MTEHQLKAWQTGGGAVMHATVIPFQRTQTNSPDYVTPAIEKDWPSVISDTASDCREDIARIRKAKALLSLLDMWGDKEWSDIASEIETLVIEPATDRIMEMLRSHGYTSCSDRDECEIDELVSGTTVREIMACQPWRRTTPQPYVGSLDFGPLHWAEVLTGLPLSAEVEERKV